MKRIALALAAATVIIAFLAYFTLPDQLDLPLRAANRQLAGLTEKTVHAGGHDIHYLEGGHGVPVVLLHGIFAEKDQWVDFARYLTPRYHVIIPDLPGYGDSGRSPSARYDYAAQRQRLDAFFTALGLGRIHLAGNSMGGTLAAVYALHYPGRVATLAFIGAPHGIRSPTPSEADRLIDAGALPLISHKNTEFDAVMARLFVRRPFIPYPIMQGLRQRALRDADANVRLWREQLQDRYLLQGIAPSLRLPTLVLWGEGDRIFDVSGAAVLRAALKDGAVATLPATGHLPMVEAPGDTARRYLRFLLAQSPTPNAI